MTSNPLKDAKPKRPTETQHQIADRMNAYTRGQIAGHKGQFIERPRTDVHWVVRDNRCVIEWVR